MTRPSGRRRLPAVAALALLCLVARCCGEATAAGRHALQATHAAGLVAPARRFGLPRRLAQAAEGEEEESSASELDSSALLEEEEEAEEEDSSGMDELLDDSDLEAALDGEDSTALGAGGDGGAAGGGDGASDGEDGEDSDLLLSSDEDGLFDDEDEEDDGFDWSSDLRLWGDDEEDDEDDRFGAQALLDDSALFSDDAGFSDDSIFDFWAEDEELPPDFGAQRRARAAAARRRGLPVAPRVDMAGPSQD